MSQYREAYVNLEARARRKQQDVRRMHFRRAIEDHDERRQLQAQLMEFPDLLVIDRGAAARRKSVSPAR